MNDLDDLRAALRQPPEEPFAEPDLARIMKDGARIRRRRRLVQTGGAVAAAAAVVLVVVFAVQLRQPAPHAIPPAASATLQVSPPSTTSRAPRPLGDIIATGIRMDSGEFVLYPYAIDEPKALPDIHFGLMAAVRDADGRITPVMAANETRGLDTAFGFHGTSGGDPDVGPLPVFGYFAGPVARITTTVDGRAVAAHLRTWTTEPDVVVFWFDPAVVKDARAITPLVAYDKTGKRLTK